MRHHPLDIPISIILFVAALSIFIISRPPVWAELTGSTRSTYYEEPTQHYPESNLLCQSIMDGKVYTGYCWRI